MKEEYVVVYEHGEHNWSAYSPDVPGCVAAAESFEETQALFSEALEFHIEGLREAGEPIPRATSRVGKVAVNL
jgi:predicted RNase H-like HicB family nuclease